MAYKNIVIEKKENVGIVKLDNPKTLNALNIETLKDLDHGIEALGEDPEIYVIIITGNGKAFVAGADISEMVQMNAEEGRQFADFGSKVFRKIELLEKPVIAAVNGYALGGGLELAMACDLRIASNKAKFGQPEVGLGITPGFAGSQRLPRLVGLGKAKELIFTGDVIGADVAEKIGLVNKVVDLEELMNESLEMAKKIAKNGQMAVGYSKTAINRGFDLDFESGNEIEKMLFGLCFATDDQKEGMKAFLEKRKPSFKNK
jgi:enoyl-CoA hydratase